MPYRRSLYKIFKTDRKSRGDPTLDDVIFPMAYAGAALSVNNSKNKLARNYFSFAFYCPRGVHCGDF